MASKEVKFLGEGNAERLLLRWFKIPDNLFREVSGNGNIAAFMSRQEETIFYRAVIGITDDDKRQISYFAGFREQERGASVLLKKHPDYEFYLVILCPAFEKWLLDTAQKANVSPAKYQIPETVKELKKRTRRDNLETDKAFEQFFKAVQEANPPDFQTLERWLKEFRKMGYEN